MTTASELVRPEPAAGTGTTTTAGAGGTAAFAAATLAAASILAWASLAAFALTADFASALADAAAFTLAEWLLWLFTRRTEPRTRARRTTTPTTAAATLLTLGTWTVMTTPSLVVLGEADDRRLHDPRVAVKYPHGPESDTG